MLDVGDAPHAAGPFDGFRSRATRSSRYGRLYLVAWQGLRPCGSSIDAMTGGVETRPHRRLRPRPDPPLPRALIVQGKPSVLFATHLHAMLTYHNVDALVVT